MTTDLDRLAASLQEKMDDKARKAYGEEKFARWKEPRFAGVMDLPSAVGKADQGAFTIFLRIEDQVITKASFDTAACGPGIISCDAACELALGKTVDQAEAVTAEDILRLVQGLPSSKENNANKAAAALADALQGWRSGRA